MSETPKLFPKPEKPKTEGWWKIVDFQGTLPGLISTVDGNTIIPDYWKAAIKAEAQAASDAGFNFFYLDVHYHRDTNWTLSYTLQPTKEAI